jgi:hypothetical protein
MRRTRTGLMSSGLQKLTRDCTTARYVRTMTSKAHICVKLRYPVNLALDMWPELSSYFT